MEATVKPCLKCPEGQPIALNMQAPGRGTDQRINYVLNEGDVRVFHAMLERAIPDVELKYGRPVVHEDGSFEFPMGEGSIGEGEPEDLYGYQRDGENRRLFHPIWPDCMERALGVFVHAGSMMVAGRCNHYLAEHFTRPVSVDQCRECSARRANPKREPMPRTAKEFIARCEARGREDLKKKLGDDIFERAEDNLKAWAAGRSIAPTTRTTTRITTRTTTSRIANSSSHDGQPGS